MIERPTDPGAISRAVASGLAGLPGVARLTPGAGVEAATYFAGGKTIGVVARKDQVTVHIVASELPIARVTERVREAAQRALRSVGAESLIEVVVEDVEVEHLPTNRPSAAPPPLKSRRRR